MPAPSMTANTLGLAGYKTTSRDARTCGARCRRLSRPRRPIHSWVRGPPKHVPGRIATRSTLTMPIASMTAEPRQYQLRCPALLGRSRAEREGDADRVHGGRTTPVGRMSGHVPGRISEQGS